MARNTRTHLFDTAETGSNRNPMVRRHLSKDEFAQRLYKLMIGREWSQADLSREADIPRDAISRYIRKMSLPEPSNLLKLAKAFKMEPADLLPNYDEVAIEMATDSPLEIRAVPTDPTMAWIRINRMVRTSSIPAILKAFEDAENV